MRTVILSTDQNPNYLNYLPYVQQAWNKLGWNTVTYVLGQPKAFVYNGNNLMIGCDNNTNYKDATYVQCIRLLGHRHVAEGIVMTSDIDMMPMSNYWNPESGWTVYGRDLCDNHHHPICYIAADKSEWEKLFPEDSIQELLSSKPNALSDDFQQWWFVDQELANERIKSYHSVPRGVNELDMAVGRVDRSKWGETLHMNQGNYIDAHMPRPFNPSAADNILSLIK